MRPPQLHLRAAQPSESRALAAWIAERHYTRCTPPGYGLALEFLLGGARVGAMLLGRPSSRELNPDHWLELTRMVFVDDTPHSTESQALGLMRRHVRTWLPRIRALIAYSDPAAGHEGTIYNADGWAAFGKTSNSKQGWRSRPGRRAPAASESTSRKVRWIRTP